MPDRLKTNCPRDCYDGCGILVEHRDGAKPRILGDPDHPVSRGRLCSKCAIAYNGVWQDENARLTYPQRRTGAKGSGQFERISWDEALKEIAENLNHVLAEHGPDALLHTHYSGTLSLIAYLFPNRFFHHLGAAVVDPDSICNAAGHVAWHLQFGNSVMGFDPRTAKDANCILVWGANPSHSAPHAHEHWLQDSPAKTLVIDPVKTKTAQQADLHLQLRPGSDAALAFGLLHVLRERGLFDQAYIDNFTTGVDEITADIDRCTPQWTAAQTGLAVDDITAAAELYGAGPSLLWCGQGLQRQRNGGNIMRAVGLLPALTGNIGKPGAGFYYLNLTPAFAGIDLDKLAGAELIQGEAKTVSHMDFADRLCDPNEFKALVSWNTNPLASAADQHALRAAFSREDLFTVVVDCFATDTARYADIILPAASFLEFDDITFSYFHLHIGAQQKINEPIGESLPNQEIFRRIAHAMDLDAPALFESDVEMIAQMMEQMKTGYDFAEFKRRGHFCIGEEPMPMHQEGKFETASGKIEIASDAAAEMGLPRTPQAIVDEPTRAGYLRLLSPASNWRLNDSYANDPHINEQAGAATIHIHSSDAARYHIADGASVCVANDTGEIRLRATIDDNILPGTALSYKGRWPGLEGDNNNVNAVHTPRKADMGESSSVHSTEIRLSAAT